MRPVDPVSQAEMVASPVSVELADVTLAGWRWAGPSQRAVVLLHAGVCDSRSWHRVAPALTDLATVWAFDRPGFGATPATAGMRDHVADTAAFLAHLPQPAWLVASSLGGAVALDVALVRPDLVAGLVLLAPGVTGSPEAMMTEQERRLAGRMDDAMSAGDLDEANRFEVWYWLDGPEQDEGRVTGSERVLALEMNRAILDHGAESEMDESVDAWRRIGELKCPVTVAVGDLDEKAMEAAAEHIVAHAPAGRRVRLTGTAHLPYLDAPDQVVAVVREAMAGLA